MAPGGSVLPGFLFPEENYMNRTIFLFDGFNLYHALQDNPNYHKYKWLDLRRLAQLFLRKSEQLEGIYYFTSLVPWSADKQNRHKNYIRALRHNDIKPIYGAFRRRTKKCRAKCRLEFVTYEEKMTDVNIAVHLLRWAMEDKFDTAVLITGDSDLVPAVEVVKDLLADKRINLIIPIGRKAKLLKVVCDENFKLKEKHLASSQFPDIIDLGSGVAITRPPTWI